jgi:hypothetical protein
LSDSLPIHLFLDENLVDELWSLATGKTIPVEKVNEIAAKVAAKAKFGLGDIWKLLGAGVSAEASGEGGFKTSEKSRYTAVLRALFLQEFVNTVDLTDLSEETDFSRLSVGTFVQIVGNNVELLPLPAHADFIRQSALHVLGKAYENDKAMNEFDKMASYLEKYTASHKAFSFVSKIFDEERKSQLLDGLWSSDHLAIENALLMSDSDHVLLLALANSKKADVLLYSVVPEAGFRRNLAAYTGNRPILFFGRIASVNKTDAQHQIGIAPIAISLHRNLPG